MQAEFFFVIKKNPNKKPLHLQSPILHIWHRLQPYDKVVDVTYKSLQSGYGPYESWTCGAIYKSHIDGKIRTKKPTSQKQIAHDLHQHSQKKTLLWHASACIVDLAIRYPPH